MHCRRDRRNQGQFYRGMGSGSLAPVDFQITCMFSVNVHYVTQVCKCERW